MIVDFERKAFSVIPDSIVRGHNTNFKALLLCSSATSVYRCVFLQQSSLLCLTLLIFDIFDRIR